MSKLENLRDSRQSYSVAFMAFVKVHAIAPTAVLCFFEGLDVQYYGLRVNLLAPDVKWEQIPCGGKESVLKLYKLVTQHDIYKNARTAFFVDRDFNLSNIPADSGRLYCTPFYSVESFYVSERVFEAILQAEFYLGKYPDHEGCYTRCVSIFGERLAEFLSASHLVNCWVYAHRKFEKENGLPRGLEASSLNLSGLIGVTLESVTSTYTIADLESKSGVSSPCTEAELISLSESIPLSDRFMLLRGKFLAYFMREFICKLADVANIDAPRYFPDRRRTSFRPSKRNFLSELSQYAETPECLKEFISLLNARYKEQLSNVD